MLKDLIKNENELVSATGVCRFCGQTAALQVLPDWNEAMINEYALEGCTCKEAKKYTERKRRIEGAEEAIESIFKGEHLGILDDAKGYLKAGVRLIIDGGGLHKLQVQCGYVKCTIVEDKEGGIKIHGQAVIEDSEEV